MFWLSGTLCLVMSLGLVMAAGSQAQAAVYRMQIHEIYYNSPGPDYGGNASLNHEWVQLHNTSGSWINLANWTLRDKAGHVFVFGSYSIKPYGYVTIHTGKGTGTRRPTAGPDGLPLTSGAKLRRVTCHAHSPP